MYIKYISYVIIQRSSQNPSFQSEISRLIKHAYQYNLKFYLIIEHVEIMFKIISLFFSFPFFYLHEMYAWLSMHTYDNHV